MENVKSQERVRLKIRSTFWMGQGPEIDNRFNGDELNAYLYECVVFELL